MRRLNKVLGLFVTITCCLGFVGSVQADTRPTCPSLSKIHTLHVNETGKDDSAPSYWYGLTPAYTAKGNQWKSFVVYINATSENGAKKNGHKIITTVYGDPLNVDNPPEDGDPAQYGCLYHAKFTDSPHAFFAAVTPVPTDAVLQKLIQEYKNLN